MVAGLRFAGSALVRRTIFVTSGKWFCGARGSARGEVLEQGLQGVALVVVGEAEELAHGVADGEAAAVRAPAVRERGIAR